MLMGTYSEDRSSGSPQLHSARSARPCCKRVNVISSSKARCRQAFEVILLPPFCSREKLPEVIQLVIGGSGFESGVGTFGSHVIQSL